MGLKQEILDAKDRPTALVEIDNWPPVYVRTLNVKELERLTDLNPGEKFEAEALATICALVLSDEAGDRVFVDEDVPMLLNKPFDRSTPCRKSSMRR